MEVVISSMFPTRSRFPLLLSLLLTVVVVATVETQEVASLRRVIGPAIYNENFSLQCHNDEVVMVTAANLCEEEKCSRDVMTRLDEKCSARIGCQLSLRELCNSTCQGPLNVTYECLRVINRDCRQSCGSDNTKTKLTGIEGYIASIKTQEKCGTSECPWLITVPPGQAINVTLFDFSGQEKTTNQRRPAATEGGCLVIKEKANPKEVTECMGRQRERHLYTTVSNTIELRLDPKEKNFLIHYKAVGCPDIVPPQNSRMKRTGDRCEIDCPGTTLKWELTCSGDQWEGRDKLGKCPGSYFGPGGSANQQQTTTGSSASLPTSILIAAVVALTVIIAVLVLTIGFVCLKKHQYETKHGDPLLYGAPTSEFEFCTEFSPVRAGVVPKTGTTTVRSTRGGPRLAADLLAPNRDNTYAADRQLEMQPLHRPLPSVPIDGCSGTWNPHDPKRIVVQLHRTGSGTETVSFVPPFPTMMLRDGKFLPCNCGGTLKTHPSQLSVNRPPSHLYFTLDPEVQIEEPATPGEVYPPPDTSGGTETQTIPRAHQKILAAPAPTCVAMEMNCANSQEMVPLNLTNRAKAANQSTGNQFATNQIPLNLTPPHKIPSNQFPTNQIPVNSSYDAHQSLRVKRHPSACIEPNAHS